MPKHLVAFFISILLQIHVSNEDLVDFLTNTPEEVGLNIVSFKFSVCFITFLYFHGVFS